MALDRRKQAEDQYTDDSSLQDKPGFYIVPMIHGLEGPAWPCKHWFDGEALKFAGRVIAVRRVTSSAFRIASACGSASQQSKFKKIDLAILGSASQHSRDHKRILQESTKRRF